MRSSGASRASEERRRLPSEDDHRDDVSAGSLIKGSSSPAALDLSLIISSSITSGDLIG